MTQRATARLRALISQAGCVVAPGVADALAARLVALEGFAAVVSFVSFVVQLEN